MTRAAAVCWLVAGVAYLTVEALAASAFAGYSYTGDVISALGAPDSPLRWSMNAGFVLQGTLFCAGALLLTRATATRKPLAFIVFAGCNAVGNVLVAAVPTGAGPLHVVGAALAIVGGNAAILAGAPLVDTARWYRRVSTVLGVAGLASLMLFVADGSALAERISVYTIIGWQVLSALMLWRR